MSTNNNQTFPRTLYAWFRFHTFDLDSISVFTDVKCESNPFQIPHFIKKKKKTKFLFNFYTEKNIFFLDGNIKDIEKFVRTFL